MDRNMFAVSINIDESNEEAFRQRYSDELKKMNNNQLKDERSRVQLQVMKTPGRRGEQIKHEEIDKEIVRRHNTK
jgi:hypothetical protein